MEKHQWVLFDAGLRLENGFVYRPDFITETEEEVLLTYLENLDIRHAHFRTYTAKRRVRNFGWGYDFETRTLIPGPSLPRFLHPLRNKIAKWLDIPKANVVEALATEYPIGAGIGWHNDREPFEHIIGISLKGRCFMRFRPSRAGQEEKYVIRLTLEPRSAYIIEKDSRWHFDHSILPTTAHRFSITFRTLPRSL